MSEWRRYAALGYWSLISLTDFLEDAQSDCKEPSEKSEIIWALKTVFPMKTLKTGFLDREISGESIPHLIQHIKEGDFESATLKIRERLCKNARLDDLEVARKALEAERLFKRYGDNGFSTVGLTANMIWELEQIRQARLLWQELKALGGEIEAPCDAWLTEAVEFAKTSLADKGISLRQITEHPDVISADLERIFIRPKTRRETETFNERMVLWEVEILAPSPDPNDKAIPDEAFENEPFTSSAQSEGDLLLHRARREKENALKRDGWHRLTDLTSPEHEYFDLVPGHAASILLYAEEARHCYFLLRGFGDYNPSKETILVHMNEIAQISHEIGRHVERLNLGPFENEIRLARIKRRHNPNPNQSVHPETEKCIACIEFKLKEQRDLGKRKNIAAATNFCLHSPSCTKTPATKRSHYYKHMRGKLGDQKI